MFVKKNRILLSFSCEKIKNNLFINMITIREKLVSMLDIGNICNCSASMIYHSEKLSNPEMICHPERSEGSPYITEQCF